MRAHVTALARLHSGLFTVARSCVRQEKASTKVANCLLSAPIFRLHRADEIRANLDRMGIEHRAEKIDELVRAAQKKRRIEGVSEGPAEFYNDKVRRSPAALSFCGCGANWKRAAFLGTLQTW
jgi:hypothetical protein